MIRYNMRKISFNDITLILLDLLYTFTIISKADMLENFTLALVSMANILLLRKVNYKIFSLFLLFMLLSLSGYFVTTLLYGNSTTKMVKLYFSTSPKLNLASFITLRHLSLMIVSVISVLAIDFNVLIFSLMQSFALPKKIGYSLLTAINSLSYLKKELFYINQVYLIRFRKKQTSFSLLIPILVFALRHTFYSTIALESRNILETSKKQIPKARYSLNRNDFIIILTNILQIALIKYIFWG